MSSYYSRDGKPITREKFERMWTPGAMRVDRERVGEATVSTIWLGLNHNRFPGPPLIFETVIFDHPAGHVCFRYATLEEAEAGHAECVEAVRQGRDFADFTPGAAA